MLNKELKITNKAYLPSQNLKIVTFKSHYNGPIDNEYHISFLSSRLWTHFDKNRITKPFLPDWSFVFICFTHIKYILASCTLYPYPEFISISMPENIINHCCTKGKIQLSFSFEHSKWKNMEFWHWITRSEGLCISYIHVWFLTILTLKDSSYLNSF